MWKGVKCRITGLRNLKPISFVSVRDRCFSGSLTDNPDKLNVRTTQLNKYGFCQGIINDSFDVNVLTYPEVLDTEQLALLSCRMKEIESYYQNQAKFMHSDSEDDIPKRNLKRLKDLDILSLRVPVAYGGEDVTTTEFTKVLEALGGYDISLARTLCGHEAGLQPLICHGTFVSKVDLLTALVSEKWLAALCLTETECFMDLKAIFGSAVKNGNSTWILNGQKKAVVNGPLADLFTVVTLPKASSGLRKNENFSVFAVKRDYGGVTSGNPRSTMGAQGCAISDVSFVHTPVPYENLIGAHEEGYSVVMDALAQYRYCVAASALGLLKKLIKLATEFATDRSLLGVHAKDFTIISRKIADITMKTYAAESMVYLTAGILDLNNNVDCSIETGLLKVFITEVLKEAVDSLYELFGRNAFVESFPFQKILRDVQIITAPEDGNDFIRILTAAIGIGGIGNEQDDDKRDIRDIGQKIVVGIRKLLKIEDYFSESLNLPFYVHPSLKVSADQLEQGVTVLKLAVQLLKQVPHKEAHKHEIDFCCFADCLMKIFAMTAVIGRASRSYSIGLPNANSEIEMADLFCMRASVEVAAQILSIAHKDSTTHDIKYQEIATKLYENNGYFIQNPFSPNY